MEPIVKSVEIKSDYIKLDSLLKFAGITQTGGQAKEMILQGSVIVNGKTVTQRGKKIRAGDRVQIDHYTIEVAGCAVP